MGLFTSFRVAPGVRLSASRRGLRAHVGPRFARVHVGGGRAGVSTGAGPFTVYGSGSNAGSRPRTGSTPRQAQRLDAHQSAAAQLDALFSGHQQTYPVVEPLQAPEPELPKFRTLLAAAEKQQLRGVGWFDRGGRRAARLRARPLAEAWASDLLTRSRRDRAQRQAELDTHWTALLANTPTVVAPAITARFDASGRAARVVDVRGDSVLVEVTLPAAGDVVPSAKPALTPGGAPTVHQPTKTERADWYRQYVATQVLLAAKEAFAAAPGLHAARVTAAYAGATLVAAELPRERFQEVDWSRPPWDVLCAIDPSALHVTRGRTRELQPVDLSGRPEFTAPG